MTMKMLSEKSASPRKTLPMAELLVSVACAMVFPFTIGRMIKSNPDNNSNAPTTATFPVPFLPKGKTQPKFEYTGASFESNVSWSQRQIDSHIYLDLDVCEAEADNTSAKEAAEQEDKVFNPAGQHLMVDIEGVDPSFLLNAEKLADSLVEVVNDSHLTLLSYHCHDLKAPMGVSCVGVLLESHVSLHTFPSAGIIVIDLFTCGDGGLFPLIPTLQSLFGIPPAQQRTISRQPSSNWLHKKRGYRYDEKDSNPESIDMEQCTLGFNGFASKEVVVSEETDFQTVQVFEYIETDAPLSRGEPNIKRERNKKLFLDGVGQSTLQGMEAYHEALVHPAMLAHPNPKRVAVIGGGEGATVREVLKHNSVEKCVQIEIDAELVEMSKTFLGEWNDCSGLSGDGKTFMSCFEDDRVEVYFEDALAWFIQRFGDNATIVESEKFDVIIMDALDPSSAVPFSDRLYGGQDFLGSILNSLTEKGVLISQTGEAGSFDEPSLEKTREGKSLAAFTEFFGYTRAEAMKVYAEAHGEFNAPWDFRIVLMHNEAKANFYATPAEINLRTAKRSVHTPDGHFPFDYIDGATMQTYHYPSRIDEDQFCATVPTPQTCLERQTHGFDPSVPNVPGSALEVGVSKLPNAGRGVFFKDSFRKGSYLAIDSGTQAIIIEPAAVRASSKMMKSAAGSMWKSLDFFMFAYGFSHDFYGDDSFVVDSGINNFINHGCNSSYVTDSFSSVNELTADPTTMPDDIFEDPMESPFFDPRAERNFLLELISDDKLIVDVEKGQEYLDNYVNYLTDENWARMITEYKAQCLNQGVGSVTAYENNSQVHFNVTKSGSV